MVSKSSRMQIHYQASQDTLYSYKFKCYIYLLGKWGKREVLICNRLKVNCVKRMFLPFQHQTKSFLSRLRMLINTIIRKIKIIVQIQIRNSDVLYPINSSF